MMNTTTTQALCELVTQGSIEASATPASEIAGATRLLPFGTSVYVPSPANRPLTSKLDVIAALHKAGMEPVPHIAARKVRSRLELLNYLQNLARSFGVHRVLVVGGDALETAGPYPDSLSLLRDGVLQDAGIHEIGVTGYPEGHPRIPPDIMHADLQAKIKLAADSGMGIEIITQFSFVPQRISEYCSTLARWAPDIPVYVGIAGPTSAKRLLSYARYCGVSTSVQALRKLGIDAVNLVRRTDPDEQLQALAQYCEMRDHCNVMGIHVFSFGGLAASAQWLKERCRGSSSDMARASSVS
jgi:methylenetetrahydrofolate reductase (NADPH)